MLKRARRWARGWYHPFACVCLKHVCGHSPTTIFTTPHLPTPRTPAPRYTYRTPRHASLKAPTSGRNEDGTGGGWDGQAWWVFFGILPSPPLRKNRPSRSTCQRHLSTFIQAHHAHLYSAGRGRRLSRLSSGRLNNAASRIPAYHHISDDY